MTNVGEVKKKPGSGLLSAGLFTAAAGVLLVIAVFSTGGTPTLLVWAMFLAGLFMSAIGFGRRILAAVERD